MGRLSGASQEGLSRSRDRRNVTATTQKGGETGWPRATRCHSGAVTGTGTSRPGTGDERLGSLFHRFWPFTHGLRRWMLLGLALTAVTPIIEAAEIWLFKLLVDEVLVPQDLEALPALVVAFVALNLASGAIGFGEVMTSAWVGERFLLRVRGSLFGHMLRLSPLQLGRRPLGDVLTRLSGDAAAIEGFLVAGPTAAVASVARVAIFAGMLVWIDPLLAALALVATPLFWLLGRRFSGAIRSAAREKRRRSGAVQALAEDVLSALPQVQAACAEDFERQRFEREGRAVVGAEMQSSRILALFRPLTDLVELSGGLAVVVGGAWALSAGRLTLGELLAFMTYLTQLYAPVRDLTDLAASASTAAAGAERIAEVLDEEPVVADVDHGVQPTGLRGIVRFDDVSFRYPGTERWALERLSFEARPGTVTAVVGPSGAGKSTLVWLLLRMADAEGGRAAGRPRRAHDEPALAPLPRRRPAPGHLPVRRHRRRERGLRGRAASFRRGRPRTPRRRCGRVRRPALPRRPLPARSQGTDPLRRAAPAHRPRPSPARPSARPDPRRVLGGARRDQHRSGAADTSQE